MLIIRVELHSAITGKVSEIGRMKITNDATGTKARGNYDIAIYRRGSASRILRRAKITDFPRLRLPVWELLRRALNAVHEKEKRKACPDCGEIEKHVHCPECGSTEHAADGCDMEG